MNLQDEQIRLAAFDWLRDQTDKYDQVLSIELLRQGFIFKNERISLVAPQGIFKPRSMELPLSITTAPLSEYDDAFRPDEYLNYKYRGDNIHHRDNVGLRECMKQGIPLVYFLGLVPGKYLPVWPVYIIGDDPANLSFTVAVDDLGSIIKDEGKIKEPDGRKLYITTMVKVRLHQQAFREKVLYAYKSRCALCQLKHNELLDAAHIIPDGEPESKPTVDNGLSLCKLHHAAFDKYFIGITPDYIVEVRKDVLEEFDGPMLQHGLKELNGNKIFVPTKKIEKPNPDFLDIRYQRFLKAS
ncbi:MAG TPA: HNH endonuclease [Ignavibacteriales bacterium]|nr:HNH endonuclease [Ignavibacteriales bacterium]